MFRIGTQSNFFKAREGSIAPLMAIVVVVMVAAGGMALDYGRSVSARTNMQAALDAAVLAAATSGKGTSEDKAALALAIFEGNWSKHHTADMPTVVVTDDGKGSIVGTATLKVETTLLKVLRPDNFNVTAISEAKYGMGKIEVALVLDNTASMAGTKIDDLKKAATDLIDKLHSATDADKLVKISIVPFSQYVNIGLDLRSKNWLSVPLDFSETRQYCGYTQEVISRSNCRMVTSVYYDDGVRYEQTYEVCDDVLGPKVYQCTDYLHVSQWNGCVGSRNYPLNIKDDTYSTPIPGVPNVSCTKPITPLTSDKALLQSRVNEMSATGETYLPAGLIWGWRALSHHEPLNDAEDSTNPKDGIKPRKVLILMTDGANTKSPNYPEHYDSDSVLANTLTSELCANIKSDKIEIYTVAFDVSDTTIKKVLSQCSSGPPYYFDAGSNIAEAFDGVAKSMSVVRLSR